MNIIRRVTRLEDYLQHKRKSRNLAMYANPMQVAVMVTQALRQGNEEALKKFPYEQVEAGRRVFQRKEE